MPMELAELLRLSSSFTALVEIRSDEMAIGVSPRTFSTNHRCDDDTNFVDSWSFENPSSSSDRCKRAIIISETTAARSPVGQSIITEMNSGARKNTVFPITLSKNSSDFRGAISAKAPATRSPMTVRIVTGKWSIYRILYIQASRLVSILGKSLGEALGEAIC